MSEQPLTIISAKISHFMGIKVLILDGLGKVIQLTGKNGAGKSSALTAVKALLLGKKYAPGMPVSAGKKRSRVEVKLSDGSTLTEVNPGLGKKGSYHLEIRPKDGEPMSSPRARIKALIGGGLAIEPLGLMAKSAAEKRAVLLELIGVDLESFKARHDKAYEERQLVNRDGKAAKARLGEKVDAPDEEVSVTELSKQLVAAKEEARRNQERRSTATIREVGAASLLDSVSSQKRRVDELVADLAEARSLLERRKDSHAKSAAVAATAISKAAAFVDPDIAPILRQIEESESTNRKVRAKKAWVEGSMELEALRKESAAFTRQIEDIEEEKLKALAAAKMPVEGLVVDDDGLSLDTGKGPVPLEQLETSLIVDVCVQIAAAMKPKLSVAFVENGNDLAPETFEAFTATCAKVGIRQVWIERIEAVGDEGVIRIEEGEVANASL